MPSPVDQVLDARMRLFTPRQRGLFAFTSAVLHGALVIGIWLGPRLSAKPPEKLNVVAIVSIPASRLGRETPPPPPPKKVEKPRQEVPPPTPEKRQQPPPVDDDVPVLAKKKPKKQATPPAQEPAKPAPAPPQERKIQQPAQRRGTATGNPLGTSVHKNRLGVEDPNFTYGYYLDLVVAALRDTWNRPAVGSEFKQAIIHLRILRDGTITEVQLLESSGSPIYDQAALRAVNNATLPPLPRGYKEDNLGANVIIR